MATAVRKRKDTAADKGASKTVSDEEAISGLARMVASEGMYAGDMWAFPMDTLDVHIPMFPSRRPHASIKDNLALLYANLLNSFKNAYSMYQLAKTPHAAFPRAHIPSPRTSRIFGLRSTKDDAWVAPWRADFLDTYKKLNASIAQNDLKALKQLTTNPLTDSALALARAHHAASPTSAASAAARTYKWRLHALNAPAEVVSLRATQAHWGRAEPRTGSRLIVHALVRFDSTQTLLAYDARTGALLPGQAPAPKRVVEHIVFERRLWYDLPWVAKDRLFADA